MSENTDADAKNAAKSDEETPEGVWGEGRRQATRSPEREKGDAAANEGADDSEKSSEKSDESGADPAERRSEEEDAVELATPEKKAPVPAPRYAFFGIVAAIGLALDLGTKGWAVSRFHEAKGAARTMEIIDGVLAFKLRKNPGGAWGFLGDQSPDLRQGFFILISIVAVGFIFTLFRKTARDQWALHWGLPLVLSGALGNLVDRIRYGEVVDFISVHLGTYEYPTFNVADIAIVAGVILMGIDMFKPRKKEAAAGAAERAKAVEAEAADAADGDGAPKMKAKPSA